MSNTKNPYRISQEAISLKLSQFVKTDINFKFLFFIEDMSCKKEPMFKWLVNTRKLASGIKTDDYRSYIKNQRREKSWIAQDFGYWSGATRYFLIGYAIEECRAKGMNLAVELSKITDIFNDDIAHGELVDRFVDDFFYGSSIDIHASSLCRNKGVAEYSTLKACFINGYRFCTDLYLALDQAKKIGPVHGYIELLKTCQALGFDELPLWYIQESYEHGLNVDLSNDVDAQKHIAAWAFISNDGQALMVAQNDPYSVHGSNISQSGSIQSKISMSSDIKKRRRRTTVVKKQVAAPVANTNAELDTQKGSQVASSLDSLFVEGHANSNSNSESHLKYTSSHDDDIDVIGDYELEYGNASTTLVDSEPVEEVRPKIGKKTMGLLNQYET